MNPLLASAWRRARTRPGSPLLAVVGVALGVAVVLGIDLANAAALRAMELSVERAAGRATHSIVGSPDVAVARLRAVRVEAGVRSAAPVLERDVAVVEGDGAPARILTLLGLDPFCEAPFRPYLSGAESGFAVDLDRFLGEPGAVLLGAPTAERLDLRPGDTLTLRVGADRRTATVVGLLEPRDGFDRELLDGLMIADIASAQELLGSEGRLTRIDLVLSADAAGEAQLAAIEARLGPGERIEATGARVGTLARLTRGFRLNLQALSLLALVVGGFLVFNALSFAVVERREELGLARTLGATRGQVSRAVAAESTLLATAGVALGLALGAALGAGLVHLVLRTINDLYFSLEVGASTAAPGSFAKAAALGLATSAVAVASPLREAVRTAPHRSRQRSSSEELARARVRLGLRLGACLLLLGALVVGLSGRSVEVSYVGLFTALVGAAMIAPRATDALLGLAEGPLAGVLGGGGRMAARGARRSLSRTSVAVAALSVALAASLGVAVLVSSFRGTVVTWLDSALVGDVMVSAPSITATRSTGTVERALAESLAAHPAVASAALFRGARLSTSAGRIQVAGLGIDRERFGRYLFVDGGVESWPEFAAGRACIISEPLAFHRELAVGDTLDLQTPTGPAQLEIAAVVRDYASDEGFAAMHFDRLGALVEDNAVSSMALTLAPGAEVETTIADLRASLAVDEDLLIRSNRSLREETLTVFDQTFAVTTVLRALTLLVALVGVFSALAALGLDARRELATLRALGMTRQQLRRRLGAQHALLGLAAGLWSLPIGYALAWCMVAVINRQAFGWTLLDLDPSPSAAASLVAGSIAVAVLAGAWPARRVAAASVVEALRDE